MTDRMVRAYEESEKNTARVDAVMDAADPTGEARASIEIVDEESYPDVDRSIRRVRGALIEEVKGIRANAGQEWSARAWRRWAIGTADRLDAEISALPDV